MISNKTTFALTVQNLNNSKDKVLVMGQSVGLMKGDGWFKGKDVKNLFTKLRIPKPSNVYHTLKKLSTDKYVVRQSSNKKWSLSPKGKVRVKQILESVDVEEIELMVDYRLGSNFASAFHSTIPPQFAPPKWQKGINQLLEEYPFENNVFLMTRFPREEKDENFLDPIDDTIEAIEETLNDQGLTLHLASNRQIDDDLLGNIAAHMWACNYGIGIFENILGDGLNYNVVTEIGAMLMTGRRCALIKDDTVPRMPTDISGLIYKSTDITDLNEVKKEINAWVSDDLKIS